MPKQTVTEKQVRVLIVEDVDAMRQYLAELLSGLPDIVVTATARNTWEARLELGRNRPDLILLDEVLPGESGVDLLHEVVAGGVQVLLLTGMEKPIEKVPPEAAGRIQKPGWERREDGRARLIEAIRNAVQRR